MNEIIAYFSTIPSSHRSLILVGGITIFWWLEKAFPLFRFQYQKWHHAGINFFFTFTTIAVNFLLAFILLLATNWTEAHHFGVLNWLPKMNAVIFMLIGLLLLDFIAAYFVHWLQHKIPFLWRFHLIHHSDTWIDTTSANRHHPGESVLRFAFTCLAVLITGCPLWLAFLYQSLSLIASQFEHANITLPKKLDQFLGLFLVTPNMHKVHHHYVLPYTDSNYGNLFSFWDRIFGTYKTLAPDKIVFGIDTYPEANEHNSVAALLKMPLNAPRNTAGNQKK
jgi:sterol desaturase/sphingolipid hydroxylase (fatty acid hydroxylase superfamily)